MADMGAVPGTCARQSSSADSALGTGALRLPTTTLITLRDEHEAQTPLPMIFDP
jgi:hypothetical protein